MFVRFVITSEKGGGWLKLRVLTMIDNICSIFPFVTSVRILHRMAAQAYLITQTSHHMHRAAQEMTPPSVTPTL